MGYIQLQIYPYLKTYPITLTYNFKTTTILQMTVKTLHIMMCGDKQKLNRAYIIAALSG